MYSLLAGVACVGLLYNFGAIQYGARFIYAKAPIIGSTLSNVISTILGWVVSGVIGNFVYDILKRKYLSKFKSLQEKRS